MTNQDGNYGWGADPQGTGQPSDGRPSFQHSANPGFQQSANPAWGDAGQSWGAQDQGRGNQGADWGQDAGWGQQGYQTVGGGSGAGWGGGGWNTGGPGGPHEPPKKKSNLTPIVAAGVGLSLIGAVALGLALNKDDGKRGGDDSTTSAVVTSTTASPTDTPTESSTPSASPSPSDTPTQVHGNDKAPGPGTYDAVVSYLKSEGFKCTDEGLSELQSSVCTHFSGHPYMAAYVGGREDGALGRVSIDIQSSKEADRARSIAEHLMGEFAANEEMVAKMKDQLASQSEDYGKDYAEGPVRYRGAKNGSIVMWVTEWVPSDAKPAVFEMKADEFKQSMVKDGYNCYMTDDVQRCEKTIEGVAYVVTALDSRRADGLARISISAKSPTKGQARKHFNTEAPRILKKFPHGAGDTIWEWAKEQPSNTGGMEYVDGKIVDYYPSSTTDGQESATIHVFESCWTGSRRSC